MKDIREITNDFGKHFFNTYSEAHAFCLDAMHWNSEDIIERKETTTVEINGETKRELLYALYVDSGSDDYVYFIRH